jgi:ribosomal protein L37AE/L43A
MAVEAHRHHKCRYCGTHVIVALSTIPSGLWQCAHCQRGNVHANTQVCYAAHPYVAEGALALVLCI